MNEVSLASLLHKTILKVSALARFTQDRSIMFYMCLTTVSPLYSLSICYGFFVFVFLFLLKSKFTDITQALPLRRVLNTSPWRTGSYIHILLSQHICTSLFQSKYGLSLSQDYSQIYNSVAFFIYSQFSTPMPECFQDFDKKLSYIRGSLVCTCTLINSSFGSLRAYHWYHLSAETDSVAHLLFCFSSAWGFRSHICYPKENESTQELLVRITRVCLVPHVLCFPSMLASSLIPVAQEIGR